MVTEQSCNYYSRVLVPLYDTLGSQAVAYIINQSNVNKQSIVNGQYIIHCVLYPTPPACMPVVVCEQSKLLTLIKHSTNCPSLRTIITMADTITEEEKEAASEAGITVFTMAEIKVCGYGGHNSLYLLSFLLSAVKG